MTGARGRLPSKPAAQRTLEFETAPAGRLALADAADVVHLLEPGELLDLVYLDPPYGVGTTMTARTQPGEGRGRKHAASGPRAYDDGADIDALIAMLTPRLAVLRDHMSERASLWLHLDHRAVHDAKVACDRVFGRRAFAGEIVWTPGNGARGARRGLSITHQTLLVYARDARSVANMTYHGSDPDLREPFAETSLAMHFARVDEAGRRYRDRTVAGKTYRYYADEGRRRGSVWTDIPAMVANTPLCHEATGYPTQKPERLLARIVRACSSPGELVCDPMCGSGTTLVAAAALGRRFVGVDASQRAIATTRDRLARAGVTFREHTRQDAHPDKLTGTPPDSLPSEPGASMLHPRESRS